MQNNDIQTQENGNGGTLSAEELAQFEQFKKAKLIKETQARISKVECDALSPSLTRTEIRALCRESERVGLGGVCVLPAFVKPCVSWLGSDPVCSLITPVSYGHGGDTTDVKVKAAKRAVKDGADEIEVYVPVAAIKEGDLSYFKRECKKLKRACRPRTLRIVLDCSVLSEEELVRASLCAADSGVNVVRLINTNGFACLPAVKSALKDRCLLKADAHSLLEMEEGEALGLSLVNCNGAIDICSRLLTAAKNS